MGGPLAYAMISTWEYGCCGTTPAEGVTVTGTLTASPAGTDDLFVAPAITGWDRDLEVARFGAVSAHVDPTHLDPALGDPHGRRFVLALSWHADQGVDPEVSAVVREVYTTEQDYRPGENGWVAIPGTRKHTRVPAAERFDVFDTGTRTDGVGHGSAATVVGFDVLALREPTAADIEAYHGRQERASRTVHLTGRPEAFGELLPGEGSTMTVDLDDPRIDVDGSSSAATGVVRGKALQVSRIRVSGAGWSALATVTPHTPATDLEGDTVFIRLLMEPS
ncbi:MULTISPECIES: DUF6578 domain-containing protein [unclassified Gordonia (in: high G+C Gram-positive bacteria)]